MRCPWRYDIDMTIPAKTRYDSGSHAPAPRMRRAVFLCYDGMEMLDMAGPANVLTMASQRLPKDEGYEVMLAAEHAGPVRTVGGLEVLASRSVKRLRGPLDLLVVPGGEGVAQAALSLAKDLRRLAKRTDRVVGVCGGAFLLGAAGLLDGRRAVTHWAGCELLQQRHPSCKVEASAIYVNDGPIWTSAGVTAGMDLALALVEMDHGAELALEVARWLVMYLRRPGGQAQFSAPLAVQAASHEPLRSLAPWARTNLSSDLSVHVLARRAGMSERNFARVFTDQVGVTPAAWVTKLRLEAARDALESSSLQVQEIATMCGFRNVATMHRAFRRGLGVTPLEYRRRFEH